MDKSIVCSFLGHPVENTTSYLKCIAYYNAAEEGSSHCHSCPQTGNMHRKFGGVWARPEICVRTDSQTDRQTDIHAHHNSPTSLLYRWRSNKFSAL